MRWIMFFGGTLAFLAAAPSYASSAAAGYVSSIHASPAGVIILKQAGVRTALPECQRSSGTGADQWAFDGNTTTGQARLTLLLSALLANKKVTVNGDNACDVWGGTEGVSSLTVER